MKLTAYLEQRDIRPARFAADVGVPPSTISRIISGKRMPRLDTAQKIAAATEGAVTLADLIEPSVPAADADEPNSGIAPAAEPAPADEAATPQPAGALSPEMV